MGSCAAHNTATSKDDEYVRNVVAMCIGNNDVAQRHFLDKCMRSLLRSPKLFQRTTSVNQRVYTKEVGSATPTPTLAFKIERDRVDLVMRKIAYAVFHHKHDAKWERELAIGTEYLREEGMGRDDWGKLIQGTRRLLGTIVFEGAHQDVFQYSFMKPESDDPNDQTLVMKFYQGFEVWVFPQGETTGPKLDYSTS